LLDVLRHLAGGARAAGDTRALAGLLATRDGVARPLPVGASTGGTENVGVGTRAGNTDLVVVHGEASDRDTVGGLAGRGTVLVVLLNDNTVLGDAGESVASVLNARDLASSTVDSLDTETVLRVGDLVVGELDVGDGVVITTTDGTDGETVATSAGRTGDSDVGTRVDGDTVILVVDVGTRNGDAAGGANVESIGVVALVLTVTGRVVNSDTSQGKLLGVVDGEDLNGRILDLDVLDLGVGHLVSVEELGLLLATVGALAVPPSATLTVEDGAGSTNDGELVTGDGDERTSPLLVAEGGGTLESNSGTGVQASQVKSGTGRDNSIADDDAGAGLLLLEDVGSGGGAREGTAATLLDSGSSNCGTAEKSGDGEAGELNHDSYRKECKEVKSERRDRLESWNVMRKRVLMMRETNRFCKERHQYLYRSCSSRSRSIARV